MRGYSSDRGGNCDLGWTVREGLLEEAIFQQRHEGWVGVIQAKAEEWSAVGVG